MKGKNLVDLNPSVLSDDDAFHLVAVVDGTETFQRIGRTPLLDLVVQHLKSTDQCTLAELADSLQAHPATEGSKDAVREFLDRLVEAGLLQIRFGVSEREDEWWRVGRAVEDASRWLEVAGSTPARATLLHGPTCIPSSSESYLEFRLSVTRDVHPREPHSLRLAHAIVQVSIVQVSNVLRWRDSNRIAAVQSLRCSVSLMSPTVRPSAIARPPRVHGTIDLSQRLSKHASRD